MDDMKFEEALYKVDDDYLVHLKEARDGCHYAVFEVDSKMKAGDGLIPWQDIGVANLERTYAANARLFHDLHNHLGVLRRLLTQGKDEEAVAYLDALQAPLKNLSSTCWTGDDTVDYLINSKAALAESLGVRFEAAVEFPRFTTLRGADLCAILGNLLDNALEAAQQVNAGPFVRLKIRRIQQMLVIKVENSAQPPAVEDGVLRSRKAGVLHGWGLNSAQTAAERYDGLVQTEYADGIFTAVVTLSFDALASN